LLVHALLLLREEQLQCLLRGLYLDWVALAIGLPQLHQQQVELGLPVLLLLLLLLSLGTFLLAALLLADTGGFTLRNNVVVKDGYEKKGN